MNRNLTIKLGAIALLILGLLVPLLMIDGLIQERQELRDGVLTDIARSSSYSQQLSGPLLVVPYRKVVRTWKTNEKTNTRYQEQGERSGQLYFLPEHFELDGQVRTELRARGSTRPGCSMPITASAASLRCPSNWGSRTTSPTTSSSSRFSP
ncbi:Inner membrane protein CreD [Pseudomonas chlororaphis subsp. aurantiaca]|nr:Inner membrane protein CreD [Pseudomonas chlororaphis subsp. aurantiaca]